MSLFTITTTVRENAQDQTGISTTARASELRNGQIVSLKLEPVQNYIIRVGTGFYMAYTTPEFTVAGLKTSASVPSEIPAGLPFIYDAKTGAVTLPAITLTANFALTYRIAYANGTTRDLTELTLADFKDATTVTLVGMATNGAVFDELGATTISLGTFRLDGSSVNPPLVDLATMFATDKLSYSGSIYNLPAIGVLPSNVTLQYAVAGRESVTAEPRDVSIYSSLTIRPLLTDGTAALFTTLVYNIPAQNRSNSIQVPESSFATPSYFGFNNGARVVFSDDLIAFAQTPGVVASILVMRDGVMTNLNSSGSVSFSDQVDSLTGLLRNGDQIQVVFSPKEGMVFATADNSQSVVSTFQVDGLGNSSNNQNDLIIALSVVAVAIAAGVAVFGGIRARRGARK